MPGTPLSPSHTESRPTMSDAGVIAMMLAITHFIMRIAFLSKPIFMQESSTGELSIRVHYFLTLEIKVIATDTKKLSHAPLQCSSLPLTSNTWGERRAQHGDQRSGSGGLQMVPSWYSPAILPPHQ